MKKIITNNEKETFDFGLQLGRSCRGGEVFALCGDLGAGKTRLLQGLAQGLGVTRRVNSPTFNILKIYHISGGDRKITDFCHIDAYRLKSAADLEALGIAEYLNSSNTVTAIEWAEKVKKIWSPKTAVIKIKQLSETTREITYFLSSTRLKSKPRR
jgi:tRNA threonylcarbamoyladenosine biosynthesis protein TsaE